MLVIGDSDSYVKWGAALASGLPAAWAVEIVVLASPVQPSARQLEDALAGSAFTPGQVRVRHLTDLARVVAELRPDAVLLALRGPMVRVVIRAIGSVPNRPVLVSGFPGITIPAVPKAIVYREQTDLIVVHSRREVREFSRNAERMPVSVDVGLSTLPFLNSRAADGASAAQAAPVRPTGGLPDSIVFAAQAIVPRGLDDRIELLEWLVETARAHPGQRVVVKVRARAGEAQTHAEAYDFGALLDDPGVTDRWGGPVPANLVVEDGPMADHLARAVALVTVSSTAALEAVAADIPVLLLDDFGIAPGLINTVFIDSGLFGDEADLRAGRFHRPRAEWLEDNYFHGAEADDWRERLEKLVAERDAAPLQLSPQRHNLRGGRLRRAWDRKRVLGSYDDSVSGFVVMIVAVPSLWVLRRARRMLRALMPGPLAAPLGRDSRVPVVAAEESALR
ncbi:hypothetical protein ASC59_08955 [Leifsonia sp. Root1293]|nr:hypothetical protein ASC59_08955 [Leifsonia sp. Root1293]KRA12117.1 hypothetical protein ASD61_08955 [Leifsonia sp. Root60]